MYGLQALCLGHKSMAKNLVHNLQYEPKTWLIRGIYGTILSATEEVKRVLKGRAGVAQNIYDTRIHKTTWVEFMIWHLKSLMSVQKLST